MSPEVVYEAKILVHMALKGVQAAFIYDVVRIFRRVFRHRGFLLNVEDYIFWVVWGFLISIEVFRVNSGLLRFPHLAAFAAGGTAYFMIVGNFFVRKTAGIINKVIFSLKKPLIMFKMKIKMKAGNKLRKIVRGREKNDTQKEKK